MKMTNLNNKFNYDIALGSSIISDVCCLIYIQQQNKKISELIDKNNLLVESVKKLNDDLTKLGEEIALIHTKSAPIYINTSENTLFNKPLLFIGVVAVSLGVSYYFSSLALTKVSSLVIPKIVSFSTIISKLPFFEQSKELTVVIKELSTTLLIEMLDDNILSVKFRHVSDENFISIIKAIEVFLKSREEKITMPSEIDEESVQSIHSVLSNGSANEKVVVETLSLLTNLF